ncbi:MAG: hypothetical protein ABSH56_19170 [Bryobacteraceae bacterium]|jgi:hypothetical protein
MLSRRFACLLLGMWLAGILLMTWVDWERARSVDTVLNGGSPAASLRLKALPPDDARMLLTYQANEQARWYQRIWEDVQVFWGALFFAFLLFGTREGKLSLGLCLGMLAVALAERFLLSPEILGLGKIIDFIRPDLHSGERNEYWVLHNTYRMVELVKLGAGCMLATVLLSGSPRRLRDPWEQVHVIDKADYGHIDR